MQLYAPGHRVPGLKIYIKAQDDSPRGLRNKILLPELSMRRRSELVGFEFGDVTCLLNGRPALRLGFSKADQYGEGRLIEISKSSWTL